MVLEREFQANFFNERRNSSTNLEEINGDLPEADFWPGMTSGVPVIRPKLANTDDGDLEPLWL